MSLNKKIPLILSIAFFAGCIALIIYMLSSPLNPATKKSILIYLLVYGGLTAIIYLFKNIAISFGCGVLGLQISSVLSNNIVTSANN